MNQAGIVLAAVDTPAVLSRDLWTKLVDYLPNLITAIVVLIIGWWLAGRIQSFLKKVFAKRHVDPTLSAFLAQLGYWLMIIMVAVTALSQAGVTTTSIITVLGASTLAIGLALQSSLSNFAAGVMIILFRHFRVGDAVEAGGIAGVVEEISIFDTILVTADNRKIVVPNGKIIGAPIVNASAKPTRRLDLVFSISYESDLKLAKDIILAAAREDSATLPAPPPAVAVSNLGESSVDLTLQAWVQVEGYPNLRGRMLEAVKTRFDAQGIVIPYPQREVHLRGGNPPSGVTSSPPPSASA